MILYGEVQPLQNLKVKRKDVDEFSEEFSDFSISAPARKIRRLDVDWPLKTEEVVMAPASPSMGRGVGKSERFNSPTINTERAIVLFNSDYLTHAPTDQSFSVSLDQDVLAGLKNKRKQDLTNDGRDSRSTMETSAQCFAIVPWAPSRIPSAPDFAKCDDAEFAPMDEEMGENAMELEGVSGQSSGQTQELETSNGSFRSWQHQHCWIPQPPQNVSTTPVTWLG